MCPVESPTGADPALRLGPAQAAPSPGFSRASAAQIVGLAPSTMRRWEDVLLDQVSFDLDSPLTFADLVALAVLSATVRCLGAGADEFAFGIARVFEALRDRTDVERLDGHAALVGRDSARIAERYDHEMCAAADILVIPLRPILADFRGQAFA
jgi:hypothetical protein